MFCGLLVTPHVLWSVTVAIVVVDADAVIDGAAFAVVAFVVAVVVDAAAYSRC